MANGSPAGESPSRGKRADAQRNRETVLAAAAEVFVSSGVDALQPETDRSAALHACFLDRLLPVCAQLLDAAVEAGDIRAGTQPYELMRGASATSASGTTTTPATGAAGVGAVVALRRVRSAVV